MKLRGPIYFLIYLIAAPLVGFACIEIYGFIYAVAELGVQSAISDRSPKANTRFYHLKFFYLFGGLPVAAAGLYAAQALTKYGSSSLRTTLRVAILASLVLGLFAYFMWPSFMLLDGQHIVGGVFILAAVSAVAVFVIRIIEPVFRRVSSSVKSQSGVDF